MPSKLVTSFALGLLLALAGCQEPDTASAEHALIQGAPSIVSTTINAPMASGRYQVLAGKQYTATVTVDAGTITYLTRVLPYAWPSSIVVNESPAYKDDTVIAYAGHYVYTFKITPSTAGNFQARFAIQDRGSWNIYDPDAGVPVTVSTGYIGPYITSTTIDAPVWQGRYQLAAGHAYAVTVKVAMSNVTYSARVEGNGVSSTLHMAPTASSYVSMQGFGADQVYTFTITPDSVGWYQVAYQLRDAPPPVGTDNAFAADAGVAITVQSAAWPRITSTTITGVTPTNGQYVLTIGQRYDVVVHVVPGTTAHTVAAEQNDQLGIPASANLHNVRTSHVPFTQPYDFHFTITPGYTPSEPNSYQIGFMLRDCWPADPGEPPNGCTGISFGYDGGIRVVAAAPYVPTLGGLYGYVTRTSDHAALGGAKLQLENGATTWTASNGFYTFSSVPAGAHTLAVTMPGGGYSQTIVTHLGVPAPGMRVDADLEEYFATLASSGMTYTRYIDYLRGRTLIHVVRVPRASSHVEVTTSHSNGYETATGIANRLQPKPKVTINGGFFDYGGVDANAVKCNFPVGSQVPIGYLYAGSYFYECQFASGPSDPEKQPVLGITGTSTNQQLRIVEKSGWFGTSDWAPLYPGFPLWDDNRDGASDVSYALQMVPILVEGGNVQQADHGVSAGDFDAYWSRTAVGLTPPPASDLLLVVADGESLSNCQGANMFELATFFHDVLGADAAMNLDGGGSTSMALYRDSAGTVQFVNTPTSENLNSLVSRAQPSPLFNFVIAW